MTNDERAIRELVETWFAASQAGDLQTVLSLMTEDMVFMVSGQAPFGKEAFAKASQGQKSAAVQGSYEIAELKVLGDWAYLRNHIKIAAPQPAGRPAIRRSGYTLTILKKDAEGRWRLARDANLLAEEL